MTAEYQAGVKHLLVFGSVSAIPSVHGEMIFAEAAYRAVLAGGFDVLALELPRDLAVDELAEAVDRIWPSMGVALIRGEGLGSRNFEADGQRREVNAVDCMVPISPCDSLVAALRAASVLRKRGGRAPAVEFCDLPAAGESGPLRGPRGLPDPWYVAEHGLSDYLERNRSILEGARVPERDGPREAAMAAALRRHASARRRVLFVCGMAHIFRIAELLEECRAPDGVLPEPGKTALRGTESFSVDAAEAWFLGWSGIPAVAGSFVRRLEGGGPFSLDGALAQLKESALVRARDIEEQSISARQVLAWEKYLAAKLALRQRFCPHLQGDLTASAADCVQQEFSRTVQEVSLRYPFDPPDGAPRARVALGGGRIYLLAGGQGFLLPERENAEGESRTLPAGRPFPLGPDEIEKNRRMPTRRYSTAEDTMQRGLMQAAWRHGERLSRSGRRLEGLRVAEFEGDLGRGIDWPASLRAWAEGAPAGRFFVKIPTRYNDPDPDRDAGAYEATECPVAWLFRPGAAVQTKASGSFGKVYSSFYWVHSSTHLCGGLITQEKLAYAVNVLRGRIAWTEDALKRLLASLDERLKPTVAPWSDKELEGFEGPELCVAAAVRWAADRAVVVAPCDYVVPRKVWNYAVARKVELVRAPWECFPWEARRRLAIQHTMPAASMFCEPDARLVEHCEPVPAGLPRAFSGQ
jgi:hypothetical protein